MIIMAIPLVGLIAAVLAGTAGVVSGVEGISKMKEASDKVERANYRHSLNLNRYKEISGETISVLDDLGNLEFDILASFKGFADLLEYVQGRPEFKPLDVDGVELPKYNHKEIEKISMGAVALKTALGSAVAGVAGGIAASGATTAAVTAFCTAGTGAAISGLTGVAATNAALAALGGGTIAAGGGGMALGSMVLGGATLGIGLLAGGIIINIFGDNVAQKADQAERDMKKAEEAIDKLCKYFNELRPLALEYKSNIEKVNNIYRKTVDELSVIILYQKKYDWEDFTTDEQIVMKNAIDLVALLRYMCKIKLVEQAEKDNEINTICRDDISKAIDTAQKYLNEGYSA